MKKEPFLTFLGLLIILSLCLLGLKIYEDYTKKNIKVILPVQEYTLNSDGYEKVNEVVTNEYIYILYHSDNSYLLRELNTQNSNDEEYKYTTDASCKLQNEGGIPYIVCKNESSIKTYDIYFNLINEANTTSDYDYALNYNIYQSNNTEYPIVMTSSCKETCLLVRKNEILNKISLYEDSNLKEINIKKYSQYESGIITYTNNKIKVYNIKNMKEDNYQYLIKRFKYHLKLFDKVRIDYFRGYDSFFKIPIGKTGIEGFYTDGVSYGFFNELFKDESIKVENLIIEDLGEIREETVRLREHYGFTRQKILQFSIDLDNLYDRDNDDENVLVFPGNHDCNTIYGWYKTLNDDYKWKLKEFLRRNECYDINVNVGIMQYLLKCKARMPIIMVQDILGLDENSRINIPGTESDKNWSWKLIDFEDFKKRIKDYNT